MKSKKNYSNAVFYVFNYYFIEGLLNTSLKEFRPR